MAKAAPLKSKKPAPKKSKPAPKTKVKVKVPTRKLSVERRRGGSVSVVVQQKLEVAAPPKPPAPVARPVKLTGTPLEISKQFFETHQLPALAAALPASVMIDDFAPRARTEGFDRVFIFPPVKVQRAATDQMVMQLVRVPSVALAPSQQYSLPWLFDLRELAIGEVRGRPEGSYALAIADGPLPDDTRDRKAAQLETRFQALGQSSLTVFEYMVLQRLFAEERQDHRFDQNEEAHGHPTGWQWLLDQRSTRGAIHVSWNIVRRRVEIEASPPGHFNAKRGAHPTLIKPV